MVDVEYVPYSKITIHEIIEQDNKTFFEEIVRHALAQQTQVEPSVNWIDGIAFSVSGFPATEDIVKENLNGRIHFASVSFTKVDFKPKVEVAIGSQNFSARLRRVDNVANLADVVKFLKTFKPE